MFDLVNIFDIFLPQLLLYPNPSDPLNPTAAKMLKDTPEKYESFVRDHVKLNASEIIILDDSKKINKKDELNNNTSNKDSNGGKVNLESTEKKKKKKGKKDNLEAKKEESDGSVISEASVGELDEDWQLSLKMNFENFDYLDFKYLK